MTDHRFTITGYGSTQWSWDKDIDDSRFRICMPAGTLNSLHGCRLPLGYVGTQHKSQEADGAYDAIVVNDFTDPATRRTALKGYAPSRKRLAGESSDTPQRTIPEEAHVLDLVAQYQTELAAALGIEDIRLAVGVEFLTGLVQEGKLDAAEAQATIRDQFELPESEAARLIERAAAYQAAFTMPDVAAIVRARLAAEAALPPAERVALVCDRFSIGVELTGASTDTVTARFSFSTAPSAARDALQEAFGFSLGKNTGSVTLLRSLPKEAAILTVLETLEAQQEAARSR